MSTMVLSSIMGEATKRIRSPRFAITATLNFLAVVGVGLTLSGLMALQNMNARADHDHLLQRQAQIVGTLCSMQDEQEASDLEFAQNLRSVVQQNAAKLPRSYVGEMERVLNQHIDVLGSHPSCTAQLRSIDLQL